MKCAMILLVAAVVAAGKVTELTLTGQGAQIHMGSETNSQATITASCGSGGIGNAKWLAVSPTAFIAGGLGGPPHTVLLSGVNPTCSTADAETPCATDGSGKVGGFKYPKLFSCVFTSAGHSEVTGPIHAQRSLDKEDDISMGFQVRLDCPAPKWRPQTEETTLTILYRDQPIPFVGQKDGDKIHSATLAPTSAPTAAPTTGCLAEAQGVCLAVNTNPNALRKNSRAAHEYCRSKGARLCHNDELQVACEHNLVTRTHWAWTQGGEGNDNQEAVGMYLSGCTNDDWNRNDDSGGVICCKDKTPAAQVSCDSGKEVGMGHGTVACATWNGRRQGQGTMNFPSCAKFCQSRGDRLCLSPESFAMCQTGEWTDGDHSAWQNGGEGNNNQEYMGRYGGCQVDDWPKGFEMYCNCCQDFIKPVTKAVCKAKGHKWSDSSAVCFTGLHGHGNFASAIEACSRTNSRMCHNHEIRSMLVDGTIQGCSHAIWSDGGEGNDNQEESGVYCSRATDDWSWTTGSLHAACCISGDVHA